MGLKCSILGHSYDPAGVEREREQRGSEVVTVVRELEECSDCGAQRVVSENTEVTAVVDAEEVGVEADDVAPGGTGRSEGQGQGQGGGPSGIAGAVERSGAVDDDAADQAAGDADASPRSDADVDAGGDAGDQPTADHSATDQPTVDHPAADDPPAEEFDDIDPDDPAADDAEILTDDDEAEREPGQWPEEADSGPSEGAADPDRSDEPAESDGSSEPGDDVDDAGEESLSGITVPEGRIVCPECDFEVEAQSGYREGDPCPECGAWLDAERTD